MNYEINLCQLNDYKLIKVSGLESEKYLQGQLTLDMETLSLNEHYLAAHCDPKGKVTGVLRIWQISEEEFLYLIPTSLCEQQLRELKKYAVFSKVSFSIDESISLEALLFNDSQSRNEFISSNVLFTPHADESTLQLPSKIITNQSRTHTFLLLEDGLSVISVSNDSVELKLADLDKKHISVNIVPQSHWYTNLILRGEPLITDVTIHQFIPQALNLQALNAISFTKGCYTGQEMVARAKYRGANKRALYCLVGNGIIETDIGSGVEMQLGENWRETGTILAVAHSNEKTYLQVVLNNDLDIDAHFRIPSYEDIQLDIQALPYGIHDGD